MAQVATITLAVCFYIFATAILVSIQPVETSIIPLKATAIFTPPSLSSTPSKMQEINITAVIRRGELDRNHVSSLSKQNQK